MRREWIWAGMVFQIEPGARTVMPTTSWQVSTEWVNWKIERSLQVSDAPRSRRLASPMRIWRVGEAARAGAVTRHELAGGARAAAQTATGLPPPPTRTQERV